MPSNCQCPTTHDCMELLKIPDRSKTYYKITNINECHYSLQYHDGLIIDPNKFDNNPKHSCVKGGIYFTIKEYLYKFSDYGRWIRPIMIPKDAKVILDSNNDKYRADRLFLPPCVRIDVASIEN